jgi:hypothetical protein
MSTRHQVSHQYPSSIHGKTQVIFLKSNSTQAYQLLISPKDISIQKFNGYGIRLKKYDLLKMNDVYIIFTWPSTNSQSRHQEKWSQ